MLHVAIFIFSLLEDGDLLASQLFIFDSCYTFEDKCEAKEKSQQNDQSKYLD